MDDGVGFLTIVMALGAIWTVVVLVHRGKAFWTGDLGASDQQLAAAVALFVVIPAGVLLHEFGHALATWSVGGRVVDFQWEGYSGSVTPVGFFTELGGWWISVAGTVLGTAFGLLLLAAAYFGNALSRPLRYVLLVAGVLQLLYGLVGYPLLSLSASFEDADWKDIYDFSATPVPSALTAVVHAGLLAAMYACRGRLDDLGFGLTSGTWDELRRLRQAIADDPRAPGPWAPLALHFAKHRAVDRAERTAETGLRQGGEHSALYVPLADALLSQERYEEAVERLPRGIELAARDGLEVDGVPGDQWLRGSLGIAQAASGRGGEALETFSKLTEPMASNDAVKRWRAKAAAGPQLPQPEADA